MLSVRINQSLRNPGRQEGGQTLRHRRDGTQEVAAQSRLDRLLDLRFEQLKKDVLVDVKD